MRIDTHLHVYADPAVGLHEVGAYPIVEYGEFPVEFAGVGGSVDDALAALAEADVDYAAMLGSFELPELPHPRAQGGRWNAQPEHPEHREALIAYNHWLCTVGQQHPQLLPFVTANPAVLSSAESYEHLSEAFSSRGARGLKLHPIAIRTYPDDPGLAGVYDACHEAGAPIVFHGGPDVRGYGWSQPSQFAALAQRRPELKVIMAHLGGASWRETAAIAQAFPGLFFDLSEIVIWMGAPRAPRPEDVVTLIREIGAERITLGSDFPWYTPGRTGEIVASLPGLGEAERSAILGETAARLLSL